ncbi:MAG TPA: CRISPR-associated endoribonuclease Cas6 [Spirochaetota bacterium]|nr:CRISPR-associated endoribonuclease Cas6 [Spirochaetota bacterium]HOM38365.1 CRISPR-associated endoribonuclease Cas6 [Spirochaetota bacterium]HPQ48417.1 CRISPR-associated endoribonuclease Cas6 [Spirochaetota bacterium]
MRFKLIFNVKKGVIIPFNYHYELGSALYKVFMYIKKNSKYLGMDNTQFLNHITFSRLEIPQREIRKDGILSLGCNVFLKLSLNFPDIGTDLLWKAFLKFNNTIQIVKKTDEEIKKIELILKDISFCNSPEFKENMKFKMLSPLVITKKDEKPKYVSIKNKDKLKELLKDNLLKKFEELYGKKIEINNFDIEFDENYCKSRDEKDLYSLITMKEGTKEPFWVLGILAPFELKAPTEIIKVGYFSGFGEKTSMGFGMVETVKENNEE